MAIATFKVTMKGLDALQTKIDGMKLKSQNLNEPLHKAGNVMLKSIDTNFETEGRPEGWMPLSPLTMRAKLAAGYGGKILTRTGNLKRSIAFRVTGNKLHVGTSTLYAAIHQFGGVIKKKQRTGVLTFGRKGGFVTIRGRPRIGTFAKKVIFGAHTIYMPPRKFLLFQDEDVDRINSLVSEHILKDFLKGGGNAG